MLIELTGVPHPDFHEGKPQKVYVDASRVLLIERGVTEHVKAGAIERQREATEGLWDELQRINGELAGMHPETLSPGNERDAQKIDRWMHAREAAASLQAAYGLVRQSAMDRAYHPRVACTVVSLACGTALEHGVMLSRAFVTETPEEVAEKVRLNFLALARRL